jgi:hypothetical protein
MASNHITFHAKKGPKIHDLHTLEGVILPVTWNRQNQAQGFSIFTEDGDDILIDSISGMKKIRDNLNARVKVEGHLYDTDMGEKVIRISKVKKIRGLL